MNLFACLEDDTLLFFFFHVSPFNRIFFLNCRSLCITTWWMRLTLPVISSIRLRILSLTSDLRQNGSRLMNLPHEIYAQNSQIKHTFKLHGLQVMHDVSSVSIDLSYVILICHVSVLICHVSFWFVTCHHFICVPLRCRSLCCCLQTPHVPLSFFSWSTFAASSSHVHHRTSLATSILIHALQLGLSFTPSRHP